MADIISAGQTQCTIDAMMRGEADDKSVQVAIASLLIAMSKLTDEMAEVKQTMWKKEDLTDFVDRRHKEKCDDCPARKYVESLTLPNRQVETKKRPWFVEIVSSETLRYFILVVILVWTIVTMRTTQEQADDIMDRAMKTLSGGVSK